MTVKSNPKRMLIAKSKEWEVSDGSDVSALGFAAISFGWLHISGLSKVDYCR